MRPRPAVTPFLLRRRLELGDPSGQAFRSTQRWWDGNVLVALSGDGTYSVKTENSH